MKRVLLITLLITIILPSFEATGADWKFFGGTTVAGEEMITFYDAESSKYISGGPVRVWVEAIGQVEFKTKMKTHKKQIIEKSAEKIVNGYYPPYSLANKKTSYDDLIEIVAWEVLANSSEIDPRAKLLFEINCIDKKIRTLSGTNFKNDGDIKSSTKMSDWDYISPESNGENLQKILCN